MYLLTSKFKPNISHSKGNMETVIETIWTSGLFFLFFFFSLPKWLYLNMGSSLAQQ